MTVENWEMLWKFVFIGLILIFAVMAILVSFFGASDIKRMLQKLRDADASGYDD